MDRLVDVSTKETVQRLLKPEGLLRRYQTLTMNHSDLVHFLFKNGLDDDIIHLLEIVDSKAWEADRIRKGLLQLYKQYEGAVKAKDAWGVIMERLENTHKGV